MSKLRKLAKDIEIPKQESLPSDVIVPTNTNIPDKTATKEYRALEILFDKFNRDFFGNMLPDPMFNYVRKPRMLGHYAPDLYSDRSDDTRKSEIALNPNYFPVRTDKQIASTVLHEMVHVEQKESGTAPKRGYHNRAWADRMEALGLMPSNTGAIGGKRTGQQMDHYTIPGGAFERAFDELAATGWKLNLQSAIRPGAEKRKDDSHTKFVCTNCGWIVRGKPDTEVVHKPCGCDMLPERPADQLSDQSLAEAAE
jgi:hypothetical protein